MTRPEQPSLSLVVCTRNRAMALNRCLAAIAKIRPPLGCRFDFILVDNGSTDETATVFKRHARAFPFPSRYLFEPAPGVGNALNCGYRASSGAIVAFTDDDCYPAVDFADAVLAGLKDPTLGVVTGRILLHDPDDAPLTIEESSIPRRYPAGSYVRPGQFTGANLSFRRAALDGIGGFDPLFGPGSYIGSGADCDAASRVCLAGWDGQYDPRIIIHHHHGRQDAGVLRRLRRRYAIGSGGYHMKLLVELRRPGHVLRYLSGLPRKLLLSPSTLYWEAVGALRFIRRPPRSAEAVIGHAPPAPRTRNNRLGLLLALAPALYGLRHMAQSAMSFA